MTALHTPEDAASCLVAAAEHSEAFEAVVELQQGTWLVHFETGGECVVEWAEHPRRLVLTTALGEPRPETRAKVHAAALTFNLLWGELGCMRLAKDDEDENLLLINDVFPEEESTKHIVVANELLRIEGLRLLWAMYIDGADSQEAAPAMPSAMLTRA
jgi:hypothetical protein